MADSATELIREAEKKLKGGFFSSPKYDEGAELYTKAGNVLKMQKKGTLTCHIPCACIRFAYSLLQWPRQPSAT
jgi:hypothetical protein